MFSALPYGSVRGLPFRKDLFRRNGGLLCKWLPLLFKGVPLEGTDDPVRNNSYQFGVCQ